MRQTGSITNLGSQSRCATCCGDDFAYLQEVMALVLGKSVMEFREPLVVRTGQSGTRRGGVESGVGLKQGGVVLR